MNHDSSTPDIENHPVAASDPGRRATLQRLGIAGLVLLGGAAGLSGCATTTANKGRIGQPIPSGSSRRPVYRSGPRAGDAVGGELPTAPGMGTPPGVIPRERWAAFGPNYQKANPMSRISRITVHHDGMDAFTTTDMMSTKRRLEAIRKGHLGNGWADIGYHYVVDPAGRVWQGRPTTLQGAHVRDNNPGNLGIMMLGNYERQRPSGRAIASLEQLIAQQRRAHGIPLNEVHTHRELAPTACPGRELQAVLDRSRSGRGVIARA